MSVESLTGHKLGQYQLHERIGSGGMGAVYRAMQTGLEREVAVKVLPPSLAMEPGYAARFTREAKTSAALEHPHIIPIYDYGTQDDISYIVMRLLTGGTLKDRLNAALLNGEPLPSLETVITLLRQLADALDYAHSRGVIHRDIKPGNVMFDNRSDVFLVDFGIAKLTQATTQLTGDSMMMGTPAYMSPEQWMGQDLTPAADQYSLAVLVYNMLTGRGPFEAPTPYAMMHQHIHEPVPPPQLLRADVPLTVNMVLERALAKEAGSRFPSIRDFATAFEDAARGVPTIPPPLVVDHLPDEKPTLPLPAPAPVVIPRPKPERTLPSQSTEPTAKPARRSWVWAISLLLLVGMIVLLIALFRPPATDNPDSNLPTLMLLPSTSPTGSGDQTPSLTNTDVALVLPDITQTQTSLAATLTRTIGETLTPFATSSRVPIPTALPSATPTPTRRPTLTPRPTFTPTLDATYYFNLGVEAAAAGDYATAISYFDIALALDPNYTDAYYQRGFAYYVSGDPNTAYNDYTAAISLDAAYWPAYASRGQVVYDWGDYPSALADYSQAIALNPDYPYTYHSRGLAYVAVGDSDSALADYTRCIELDPSYIYPYVDRGNLYNLLGRYDEAVADFDAALSLDGGYFAAYLGRGGAHHALGNYEQAISDFSSALSIDGSAVDAYAGRGDSYAALADFDSAINDFSTAVSLNPELAYGFQRLGDIYYDLGNAEEALANYQRYLDLMGEAAEQYVRDRVTELGG